MPEVGKCQNFACHFSSTRNGTKMEQFILISSINSSPHLFCIIMKTMGTKSGGERCDSLNGIRGHYPCKDGTDTICSPPLPSGTIVPLRPTAIAPSQTSRKHWHKILCPLVCCLCFASFSHGQPKKKDFRHSLKFVMLRHLRRKSKKQRDRAIFSFGLIVLAKC